VEKQLDEDGDEHLLTDLRARVNVPRQDVERSDGALDDLLHADAVGSRGRGGGGGRAVGEHRRAHGPGGGARNGRPAGGGPQRLERAHQQAAQLADGAVVAQRRVVGGAQRQVPHQPDHGLDQGPARGRVHELHDHGDPEAEAHGVLREFRLRVAGSQVAQGTHLGNKKEGFLRLYTTSSDTSHIRKVV